MSFKFNPFSGTLDWAGTGEADVMRIACEKAVEAIKAITTTDRNALGNRNFFYDATACKWVEAPPQLVTDENGEIVINLEDC